MTGRRLTWLLAILLAIPLLILTAVGLVAGTESGTRWLVERVTPYLPEALTLGTPQGSLLGGLSLDSLRWQDDRVDVTVTGIESDLELVPLIDRQLRFAYLQIASVDVVVAESEPEPDEPSAEPFELNLPVDIRVDSLVVGPVSITAPGFERQIDSVDAALSTSGSRLFVDRFDASASWADLSLNGNLRLAGRYAATLDARWRYDLSPEYPLAGALSVSGNRERYELTHGLSSPYEISSAGDIRLPANGPAIDLRHSYGRLSFPLAGSELVFENGQLTTRGWLDGLDLELDSDASYDDVSGRLTVAGTTTTGELVVDSATLDSGLGRAEVAGSFAFSEVPRAIVAFDLRELDPSTLHEQLPGEVSASGSADLLFAEEAFSAAVVLDALGGQLRDLPLDGRGEASIDGETVTVRSLDVSLGQNKLSLVGEAGERLSATADLDFAALAELDERLAGKLAGTLTVSGTREAPSLSGELASEQPAFGDYRAASATLDADVSPDGRTSARMDIEGIVSGERELQSLALTLDGRLDEHRLTAVLRDDDVEANVALDGSLVEQHWSATLNRLDVSGRGFGSWSLDAPAALAAGEEESSVTDLCLSRSGAEGQVCMTGGGNAEAANLDVAITRLPLAALPITVPVGAELSGYLEANVHGSFAGGVVDGEGRVTLVETALSAEYEGDAYTLALTDASARARVDQNRLEGTLAVELNDGEGDLGGQVAIVNVLDTRSPLTGEAALSVPDVSILAALAPEVSAPAGRLEGELTIAGSPAAPDFSGALRLDDAAFGVRQAGIRVTDINLSLSQSEPGQLRLNGEATSGGGSVTVTGATNIGVETGLRAELQLRGNDFELVKLPDWQAAASPDIRVVLDDETAAVSGSLAVPRADITVRSVPETAAQPSGDVTVHEEGREPEEPGRQVTVNVLTSLGEDVRLSGFGLTTGVEGEVRIRGRSGRPYTGNGRLSLKDGRYKAYGQELEIESGDLIFNGPLANPQLSVRAVRRIEAENILAGIEVSGTPRRLRSSVFSEPPLGDAESLSYLLTGRSLQRAGDEGDSDLLNQAAFALGLSQAGSVAAQIRGDLGLDTLTVEGGSESGRIVAGKRFGERLLVEYGYGLVDNLGSLLLRYQLNSRLVLESRAGTASELDLVYSVRKQ